MDRPLFSAEDGLNILLVLFDHLVVEKQKLGRPCTHSTWSGLSRGSQGSYLVQTSLSDLTIACGDEP